MCQLPTRKEQFALLGGVTRVRNTKENHNYCFMYSSGLCIVTYETRLYVTVAYTSTGRDLSQRIVVQNTILLAVHNKKGHVIWCYSSVHLSCDEVTIKTTRNDKQCDIHRTFSRLHIYVYIHRPIVKHSVKVSTRSERQRSPNFRPRT